MEIFSNYSLFAIRHSLLALLRTCHMLDVKDINLYYGAAQALRGVSLTAEPGKVTCVLGRNGVGKTSLLDALAGQQPVSRGAITFDGADITRLKPDDRERPGARHAAAPAAAGRTDRGHSALDHQGYRPRHRISAQSWADRSRHGGTISRLRARAGRLFRGDGSRHD